MVGCDVDIDEVLFVCVERRVLSWKISVPMSSLSKGMREEDTAIASRSRQANL